MKKPDKTTGKTFDARTFLLSLVCMSPVLLTVAWTTLPSFKSAIGIAKFGQIIFKQNDLSSDEAVTSLKRQIQGHFLDYSVYIPIEDIVLLANEENKNTRLETLMTKACGNGSLFVWVPFKIILPFYGDKVVEWCWKPNLKLEK